jgi:hypothetical protein
MSRLLSQSKVCSRKKDLDQCEWEIEKNNSFASAEEKGKRNFNNSNASAEEKGNRDSNNSYASAEARGE